MTLPVSARPLMWAHEIVALLHEGVLSAEAVDAQTDAEADAGDA